MTKTINISTGLELGQQPPPWTPAEITTAAWYDASDEDTITESSGLVSQWDDKSGNGWDVTQGTGSDQPTTGTRTLNGLNVLDFDNNFLSISSRLGLGANPDIMAFAVMQADSFLGVDDSILHLGGLNDTNILRTAYGTDGWSWRYSNGYIRYTSMSAGVDYIACWIHPSGGDYGSSTFFADGTEQASSASNNPTFTPSNTDNEFYVGKGGYRFGDNPTDCYIAEIVIVESNDTTNRQKIEGYLAWKWGLTDNLPSVHPYKNTRPIVENITTGKQIGQRPWTPTEISIEAWYDASDENSITESGGAVSQWDDKSGNDYHVTQGTGSDQPTTGTRTLNGLNVLDFDDDFLSAASRLGLGANPDIMAFAVMQADSLLTDSDSLLHLGGLNDTNILRMAYGSAGWSWRYSNGNEKNTAISTGVDYISCWIHPSGGDYESSTFFADGTEQAASGNTNPTFVPSNTDNEFYIGKGGIFPTGDSPIDGYVAEVIIVNSNDADTRQKIEGYLAWKWGLISNLPVAHPYKTNPPIA